MIGTPSKAVKDGKYQSIAKKCSGIVESRGRQSRKRCQADKQCPVLVGKACSSGKNSMGNQQRHEQASSVLDVGQTASTAAAAQLSIVPRRDIRCGIGGFKARGDLFHPLEPLGNGNRVNGDCQALLSRKL